MEFVINEALTKQELNGKASVHFISWKESYADLIPQAFLEKHSLEQCRTMAFAYPKNTFVAMVSGEVVGYACYLPEARTFASIQPSSEIMALYILKDFQMHGIGSSLLERCLEMLPSGPVVLFVLDGNEKAIRFYRERGFVFTGKKLEQAVPGGKLIELEMVLENNQDK
jgi:ribosomal protein S18 acetylase RimI-like enzyme